MKVTDLIDSEKFNLKLATQFIAGIPKGSGIDTGTWRTSGRAKKKTKLSVENLLKKQSPRSPTPLWVTGQTLIPYQKRRVEISSLERLK